MSDEERREAADLVLVSQRRECVLQVCARDRVEGAEWLVEQQHSRAGGQSARERNALALAARQLARPPLPKALRVEPNEMKCTSRAALEVDVVSPQA
jgi:hypothetical protein